jgi:AraC-like DNA-binding protein
MQAEHPFSGCREDTIASRRQAVERVILSVRERLDEPLSLNHMADIACLSPYHFNRVFHQVTGLPPTKFLYALRLGTAKRLLLTTPLSVTDVCFEVGYNSLGTFTTRFTQLVGLSPGHLRRLAEQVSPGRLESLCLAFAGAPPGAPRCPSVKGRITSPVPLEGFIFVGLFPVHIPQSRPAGGALLLGPGDFHIAGVPDGRYHLFAAAFPKSHDPLSYLLPESGTVWVGAGAGPLTVRGGKARGQNVALRPLQTTDPPLLVSLPYLLMDALPHQAPRPSRARRRAPLLMSRRAASAG